MAIFLLLLISACGNRPEELEGKTVFRYNESAGITSLDPAFARNQANIWAVNQLFNGLVQLDSNLLVQPCIAKSWEVSEDGMIYTFTLRNDVYFHDNVCFAEGKGRKVTSEDVVYSLQRLTDPTIASPGAWALSSVSENAGKPDISAPNDSIVVIKMKYPFPPFPGLLGMQYCSVVPREAVEYYGENFRNSPVGTGPFYFKMWKEGVKLVLLRNDNYFEYNGADRLPYLDAVAVSFIIDKQTAFLEFVKGNLDFISGLDASYKDELLTASGMLNPKYNEKIKMHSQPYLNTEYLGFIYDSLNPLINTSALKDVNVRKAINMGFDRKKMIRYLRNNIGEPGTKGMIPAGMPGYNHYKNYGYDYNPSEARRLLAKAGFPDGKGMGPVVLSTNASYLDICQFIQSELSKIGIELKIDVSPPATLKENIAQSRIPFFRGSWIADYPDAENYLSLFYSGNFTPQGPNYTLYNNPAFDRLFLEASSITHDSMRFEAYTRLDSIIMQDAPVVVLFYDRVLRFTRSGISGLGSNPMNLLVLKHVKKG
ncbi:MAG: ABC transporter substrate-binding protein [Lentimicrobium sp.]|nr:ABC transporter substrate-binding protein [Lentimicrobium sp.]